ncbi:MAG: hypothetical protein ACRDEB_05980 [Chitinophagaceae bacterium]
MYSEPRRGDILMQARTTGMGKGFSKKMISEQYDEPDSYRMCDATRMIVVM